MRDAGADDSRAQLGTSEASCSLSPSQVAGQPSSDGGRQGRSNNLGYQCIMRQDKMSTSRTMVAGNSSEMGLYEVPCDESLPGLGIGMTNEVFQIDGRRRDLRKSL